MTTIFLALWFSVFAHSADLVIPKAQYVEGMKSGLPGTFCSEKTYFRQCFSSTKEECEAQAKAAGDACVATFEKEMPAQFKQPGDGQTWGRKIGDCAGAKFETTLTAKKLATPDCADAKKWQ